MQNQITGVGVSEAHTSDFNGRISQIYVYMYMYVYIYIYIVYVSYICPMHTCGQYARDLTPRVHLDAFIVESPSVQSLESFCYLQ